LTIQKYQMANSNFRQDLDNEVLLAKHLNDIYLKLFKGSSYRFNRINQLDRQYKGIDLILSNGTTSFNVDEKAQLDYLNTSLPTFAFELSFLKNTNWHQGWFIDETKTTDIYFLITGIYPKGHNLNNGLEKVKITGVYKDKLIRLLNEKGLSHETLKSIDEQLRAKGKHGKYPIKELNPKTEGVLYFSKNNKDEQPINLVLRLDFLIRKKVGKTIFKM
jgi:hypothetical protein